MLFFIFSSLCSPSQLSSPIYTYNDGHKPWRWFSNFCYPSFQLPDGHFQLTVSTASQSQHAQSQIHLYQQNKLVFCFPDFLKDNTIPPSTPLAKAWREGKKTNPNRMAGTTLGIFFHILPHLILTICKQVQFSSVQSLSHVRLLQPHGLQHARPPSPGVYSNSCYSNHWVDDAIQPSHSLSSPFPPAFNLSQHQVLFKLVSSSHQVARVLEFQL